MGTRARDVVGSSPPCAGPGQAQHAPRFPNSWSANTGKFKYGEGKFKPHEQQVVIEGGKVRAWRADTVCWEARERYLTHRKTSDISWAHSLIIGVRASNIVSPRQCKLY